MQRQIPRRIRVIFQGLVPLLFFPVLSGAQSQPSAATLGTVVFPTSCSSQAQKGIVSGVTLLHSFQYEEADSAFSEAATEDPTCAMAHWGKAMAITEFLWRSPTPENLTTGRDDVKQAERLAAPTDRERRYIASMAAFYQDAVDLAYPRRVEAFGTVMSRLSAKYPDDVDAAAFAALSTVTMAHVQKQRSAEDFALRDQALKVLLPLFKKYPNHPGVAHYIIHAADSLEFAQQGLEAAERYSDIAPGSSHALHMPSHVFFWVGLWKNSIGSNLAALQAGKTATLLKSSSSDYSFHAIDFLDYAFLQNGQASKAEALVSEIGAVPGAEERQVAYYQALVGARNALELHDWKKAASLPDPALHLRLRGFVYLVRALGSARSGDADGARKQLCNMLQLKDTNVWNQIQFEELQAWLAHAERKDDDALSLLRSAAEEEELEGLDSLLQMPAREMLGDLLLELDHPEEALKEYRAVLAVHRNRYNALCGAIRAARAAGLKEEVIQYGRALIASVAADADRPGFLELKNIISAMN